MGQKLRQQCCVRVEHLLCLVALCREVVAQLVRPLLRRILQAINFGQHHVVDVSAVEIHACCRRV